MKTAVRYFSKLGNTKKIAEAIAQGAGVKAVSIADDPKLHEYVDILFLGGAPYANIMAPELREYAESLKAEQVGRVILFTTSNWSRRTVLALRKLLTNNGIKVDKEYFYAHMLHINGRIEAAREFGNHITRKS
nr:flavodoxin domain-containing protein [uncultured Ruminococcus sp.]